MDDTIERVAKAIYDADPIHHYASSDVESSKMEWNEFEEDSKHRQSILDKAKAAIEAMEDNPHVQVANRAGENSNLITIHVNASGSSVIVERGNKEACFKALLHNFLSDIYEAKDWDMQKAVKYVRSVCEKVIKDYAKEYQSGRGEKDA